MGLPLLLNCKHDAYNKYNYCFTLAGSDTDTIFIPILSYLESSFMKAISFLFSPSSFSEVKIYKTDIIKIETTFITYLAKKTAAVWALWGIFSFGIAFRVDMTSDDDIDIPGKERMIH